MGLVKQEMSVRGYASFDALAKQICEAFPDTDWPKPRSLATRLGQLDKGDCKWWSRRADFVAALATTLECPPEDLGIHSGTHKAAIFEFHDFPELPPIDLGRETPCELGIFHNESGDTDEIIKRWHGVAGSGRAIRVIPTGVTWLYFPPGTGRSLFWENLRAHTPFECARTSTVASMAQRLKRREPICLFVNDSAGERDIYALAARNSEIAILVCAPFRLKLREDAADHEWLRWQYRSEPEEKREQLAITNPHFDGFNRGVDRYDWKLHPNWHGRLLAWVDRRLRQSDSRFDSRQLEIWLREFANEAMFDTPESLIAICRFAHRFGCRNLPTASDIEVGKRLLFLLSDENPTPAHQLHQAIERWFFSPDLPWGNWIDTRSWRDLIKTTEQLIGARELVEAIVTETIQEKRAELAESILQRHLNCDPVSFMDSQFVEQNELGEVRLRPRFLVDLIARDLLQQTIKTDKSHRWGALYFDPSRRDIIDQALQLFSLTELAQVTQDVVGAYCDDAPGIGATEAIFCASSLHKDFPGTPPEPLIKVARLVLERIAASNIYCPDPWSSIREDDSKWLSTCWSWSLVAPQPCEIPNDWSNHFPGWAKSNAGFELEYFLPPSPPDIPLKNLPASERLHLQIARKVFAALDPEKTNLPEIMAPYLISQGICREEKSLLRAWKLILKNCWAQDVLAEELTERPGALTEYLESLLESVATTRQEGSDEPSLSDELRMFILQQSTLCVRLFDRSNAHELFCNLSPGAITLMTRLFVCLPPIFQADLLKHLRHDAALRSSWFAINTVVDSSLANAVVEWLDLPELEGILVATWMWQHCPAKALDLLSSTQSSAIKFNLVSAYNNEDHIDAVLRAVETEPDLIPQAEVLDWVLARLSGSRQFAPRLLDLLHRNSGRSSPPQP